MDNSSNTTNNTTDQAKIEKDNLIKELEFTNKSIITIYTVLVSILLDINVLHLKKDKLEADIDGVNYVEDLATEELYSSISSNLLFLASAFSIQLSLERLDFALTNNESEEQDVNSAEKSLFVSYLVLITLIINQRNFFI